MTGRTGISKITSILHQKREERNENAEKK